MKYDDNEDAGITNGQAGLSLAKLSPSPVFALWSKFKTRGVPKLLMPNFMWSSKLIEIQLLKFLVLFNKIYLEY